MNDMAGNAVTEALFVAGTGSFAADVAEIARDAGYNVAGLIELLDLARVGETIHELPVVGRDAPPGACFVLGAGGKRSVLCDELARAGWTRQTIVHPSAHVPSSVSLGNGVLVGPHVVLGASAVVEDDALLARGVLVGHHTRVGHGAVLNPGANVAGNVTIGAGAFLGLGCVIRDHVAIGAGAVVAAGAVVVADVAEETQVRGVPARTAA
jgi:sugar O-acyltransferase (sialic acid O-acetyltransferase NeuD family)